MVVVGGLVAWALALNLPYLGAINARINLLHHNLCTQPYSPEERAAEAQRLALLLEQRYYHYTTLSGRYDKNAEREGRSNRTDARDP